MQFELGDEGWLAFLSIEGRLIRAHIGECRQPSAWVMARGRVLQQLVRRPAEQAFGKELSIIGDVELARWVLRAIEAMGPPRRR